MPARKVASRLLYWLAGQAAPAYVIGDGVHGALSYGREILEHGWATTLCPWHEDDTAPSEAARDYHQAIEGIADAGIDSYLSVKVTELGYDHGLLTSLVEHAAERGIRVHFDAMQRHTAEPTLELLERMRRDHENLGYTLPARWQRSREDARIVAELGVSVRVVKGQFPDVNEDRRADRRAQYLEVLEALRGSPAQVGVATHDAYLARRALSQATSHGLRCELEQLYGLPLLDQLALRQGVRTRVYVPYGYAYLPYAVRKTRERPIIAWWLLRDAVRARVSGRHVGTGSRTL